MKTIHGEFFFACSKRSLTREAPTPTNISTKSEPEIEKNGTPASPATALASNVLPVPGGPTSKTPLEILAPKSLYLDGFFKNSTNSASSSFSSSAPAPSAKVVFLFSSVMFLTFALPNVIVFPPSPKPDIIFRITNHQTSPSPTNVKRFNKIELHQEFSLARIKFCFICASGLLLLYSSTNCLISSLNQSTFGAV